MIQYDCVPKEAAGAHGLLLKKKKKNKNNFAQYKTFFF